MKKGANIQIEKKRFLGKRKILKGVIIDIIRYGGEDWLGDEIDEVWYKIKLDNGKIIKIEKNDNKYIIVEVMDKVA